MELYTSVINNLIPDKKIMSGTSVRVAVVQMSCSEDIVANESKAETMVRQAAAAGAQLVLLQELFQNLYFCQVVHFR